MHMLQKRRLTQTICVAAQTAADFGLGKTTARMLRYGGQAVVQLPDAHHVSVVHLAEKPEHAVAFDLLVGRKAAERTVAAQ